MLGNETAIDKKYCPIANLSFFRLGNPAKVTEKIQKFTLDYMFCDDFTLLRDLKYKAKQVKYPSYESQEFEEYLELEYQVLKQEAKLGRLINQELVNASVVLGTLVNCSNGK